MIDELAARAYGAASEAYERGRPSYPAQALSCLVAEVGLGPASTVVDLAAGTGKLTRLLVPLRSTVVAVEPVAAMRAALAEMVPAAEVVAGTAEAMPLAGASVDAVVVAQAFHWFRAEAALAEVARVLRPGGGLGLVWNIRDDSVPWVATLNDLMRWHEHTVPPHPDQMDWPAIVASHGGFTSLQRRCFANDHELDAATLVDRVVSTSYIADWPAGDQDAL
ncbi:MAG: class I SAM-dependent methyltransferase, partial [Acidimicrobiales bacterium]